MAGKLPYLQFFPDDWLSEEKLRLCSLAARGLWMDLLCLMHKGDRRGFLQQANGTPFTREQIARLSGCSPEEAGYLLQELTTSGAASVSEQGVLYNRRMVRDEQKRQLCSEAGKRGGGNPGFDATFKGRSKGHPKGDTKGGPKHPLVYGNGNGVDSSEKEKGGVGEAEEGFAAFWAAYPRKVAKKAAEKAWARLLVDQSLLATVLAALEAQKRSAGWLKDGGQYIPHPATWLNGHRWDDQAQPVAPQPDIYAGSREWLARKQAEGKLDERG